VGEPHLLGPEGDSCVTDADFTSWLARMIETDGYPLKPGRREPMNASCIIDSNQVIANSGSPANSECVPVTKKNGVCRGSFSHLFGKITQLMTTKIHLYL